MWSMKKKNPSNPINRGGKGMFGVRYVEVPSTEGREVQGMKTSCAMLSAKV